MEISVKNGAADKQRTQCLVILAGETRQNAAFTAVDKAAGGLLSDLLKRGDLKQKPGQTLLIPSIQGIQAERVILAATGKDALTAKTATKVIAGIVDAVNSAAVSNAVISLDGLGTGRSHTCLGSQLAEPGAGTFQLPLRTVQEQERRQSRFTGQSDPAAHRPQGSSRIGDRCSDRSCHWLRYESGARPWATCPATNAHPVTWPKKQKNSPASTPNSPPKFWAKRKWKSWAWVPSCPFPRALPRKGS